MCRRVLVLLALATSGVHAQELPIERHALTALELPGSADFVAIDGDFAWVTNEGRVERLEPGVASPTATVKLPEPCGAMIVAFESLWVAECQSKSLVRIDRRTASIVARISTGLADPSGELSLAAGAGAIWILTDASGQLTRVDPATNKVVARIPVAAGSFAADFGFGSVWITSTHEAGRVQRIDPASNRVSATIAVGPLPRFLAVGEGSVWTLNQGDGSVTQIDPQTNHAVATIPVQVPGTGGDIAVGAGAVWVRAKKVLLSVIDPSTRRVVRRYGPPAGSGAVRVSDNRVWVTAHDIRKVWTLPTSP